MSDDSMRQGMGIGVGLVFGIVFGIVVLMGGCCLFMAAAGMLGNATIDDHVAAEVER